MSWKVIFSEAETNIVSAQNCRFKCEDGPEGWSRCHQLMELGRGSSEKCLEICKMCPHWPQNLGEKQLRWEIELSNCHGTCMLFRTFKVSTVNEEFCHQDNKRNTCGPCLTLERSRLLNYPSVDNLKFTQTLPIINPLEKTSNFYSTSS